MCQSMSYVTPFPSDSAWQKVVFLRQQESNEFLGLIPNSQQSVGSGSMLLKQQLLEPFLQVEAEAPDWRPKTSHLPDP